MNLPECPITHEYDRRTRPILFSGAMVRALLEGRKTQTRRVLKPQPIKECGDLIRVATNTKTGCPIYEARDINGKPLENAFRVGKHFVSPHAPVKYAVGDLLWVREAFAYDVEAQWEPQGRGVYYRADPDADEIKADNDACGIPHDWKPSIFCPRWASRITLEVTDVRLQRLQEISEADAMAEGVEASMVRPATDDFRTLWDSLNDKRGFGWMANPWIVAVTFVVHKVNVDDFKTAGVLTEADRKYMEVMK